MRNHCRIVWTGQPSKLTMHISIRDMETKMPRNILMRVHRGYIIALARITKMNKEKTRVYLLEPDPIPVSETYRPQFLAWFDSVCQGFGNSALESPDPALETPDSALE